MITWHKCSEKMPELGRRVIVALRDKKCVWVIDYKKWFDDLEAMKGWEYWAYASDFNFPKDEE